MDDTGHRIEHPNARPFQGDAATALFASKRCILRGKMGTGKTLCALMATLERGPARVLITCSSNALHTWRKELKKWFPELNITYQIVSGTPAQRKKIWETSNANFMACTHSCVHKDLALIKQVGFNAHIADEYHRAGLRNKKSKGFEIFKDLDTFIRIVFYTSGQVVSKGPQNLWAPLNILNPTKFSSYWAFVNKFCEVVDGPFGMEIVGPKNPKELKRSISSNYYHISDTISNEYLPAITRTFVPIEMSKIQRKLYTSMDNDMYAKWKNEGLDGELVEGEQLFLASTILAEWTRLRQLLVTPKLWDPNMKDWGGTFEALADTIKDNHDPLSPNIVIFTPFRQAIPLLGQYLKQEFKDLDTKKEDKIQHLWGGLDADDMAARIKAWQDTRGIMLCSLQYAQSFDLDTTDYCYFAGFDWDQDNNFQAEGRLRRMSNPSKRIFANYFHYLDTVEDRMMACLDTKTGSVRRTFKPFNILKEHYDERAFGKSSRV